jgi:hypothetical protein
MNSLLIYALDLFVSQYKIKRWFNIKVDGVHIKHFGDLYTVVV